MFATVEEALRFLAQVSPQARVTSRELVVAYALVAACVQHWPSRATESARKLLEELSWIKEVERDRYIKQRRVAISRLSREEIALIG